MAVVAAGPEAAHFCYELGNPNNGTNGQAWTTQEEGLGFVDSISVTGVTGTGTSTIPGE